MKIDPDTKQLFGQELLDQIKEKITSYTETTSITYAMEPSPFRHIVRKLQVQSGTMTKDEIVAAYMEQVKDQIKEHIKQDLSIDLDQNNNNDNQSRSSKDYSMDSNNSFQIAGESQPIEKPEDILQSVLDTLKQKKH
ncbi:hypothetical protein ACH5RR_030366 [Cinchona calisaya]|uniref:Uncharacterized protein n=1 Tax=Cinchona calisaya TaxID=153742 RepID=A0ABD2YUE1_9GENT